MPTIEITEEQLERLEAVRAEVEEALAGPYGTVPTSGAVEYLLDTYTPPDESGVDAGGATEAAPVEDRPQERNDGGLAAIDPIGSAKAAALERSGYKSVDDLKAASIADLTEVEGIGETLATRILEAVSSDDAGGEPDETNADETNADETNADGNPGDATSGTRTVVSGGTPTPGNDGAGTTRLNAMMNLLDQHADKWNESEGDEPYEVELPDGSTETARTKDDVRGLLFRHYG
jgi:hypothetical protein